ncbi:unnamed protein product, partial [Mesorhabditis spiculigera]
MIPGRGVGGPAQLPPDRFQRLRDGSAPAGPRVHFSDEARGGRAESANPPPQRRPYYPSEQRQVQVQRRKELHSSANALDEATADLLRLSAEPSPVPSLRTSQKLPKAASSSSVPRTIQTRDGGQLRPGPIHTWDTNRTTDSEASEVEMLTSRGRTRGRVDAHPAQRQGHSEDDTLDLSDWSMTVTASDAAPLSHQSPPIGRSAFSKPQGPAGPSAQQPGHAHNIYITPLTQTAEEARQNASRTSREPSHDTRNVRETEAELETQTKGPPVVRTTVEGKLRMEKIVGADLITVDSCVSSAWTVRDTVTQYKIKTTIGKRSLLIEEGKESKYRITLIENGETKAEREATLDVPNGEQKKDYLTEVSKQLLADLSALDDDRTTALTHVEIEVVEDVTNILKTYVIGETADEFYGQVPAIETYHVEDHAAQTPSPIAVEKSERIYVDKLEIEEGPPPKAEIKLEKEGRHFQGDEGSLRRLRRHDTDQTDDGAYNRVRCANVFADCDLTRREDTSDLTVRYALPLIHLIPFTLRHERRERRLDRARVDINAPGNNYQQQVNVVQAHRYEEEEEEQEPEVLRGEGHLQLQQAGQQLVEEQNWQKVTQVVQEKRQGRIFDEEEAEEVVEVIRQAEHPREHRPKFTETEAEGGQYSMQQDGIELKGAKRIRKVQRFESDSSEEWNGGSPTLVDLTKKESHSIFELTVEISNDAQPLEFQIKRAERKRETINLMTSLSKFACESEDTSRIWGSKQKEQLAYRTREQGEEHATAVVYLQKRPGLNDQGCDGVARTPNRAQAQMAASAFQERSWSSTLSLSRASRAENAQKTVTAANKDGGITSQVAEYRHAEESCAVVMKNTGTLQAQTQGQFVDNVTDAGQQQQQAQQSSCSGGGVGGTAEVASHFHLKTASSGQECWEESLQQEVKLRKKESEAQITVFYVLRRVWGNYQHALMKLGSRIEKRETATQMDAAQRSAVEVRSQETLTMAKSTADQMTYMESSRKSMERSTMTEEEARKSTTDQMTSMEQKNFASRETWMDVQKTSDQMTYMEESKKSVDRTAMTEEARRSTTEQMTSMEQKNWMSQATGMDSLQTSDQMTSMESKNFASQQTWTEAKSTTDQMTYMEDSRKSMDRTTMTEEARRSTTDQMTYMEESRKSVDRQTMTEEQRSRREASTQMDHCDTRKSVDRQTMTDDVFDKFDQSTQIQEKIEEKSARSQQTAFEEWRSRSETRSYASYESDEYEMRATSTHVVTALSTEHLKMHGKLQNSNIQETKDTGISASADTVFYEDTRPDADLHMGDQLKGANWSRAEFSGSYVQKRGILTQSFSLDLHPEAVQKPVKSSKSETAIWSSAESIFRDSEEPEVAGQTLKISESLYRLLDSKETSVTGAGDAQIALDSTYRQVETVQADSAGFRAFQAAANQDKVEKRIESKPISVDSASHQVQAVQPEMTKLPTSENAENVIKTTTEAVTTFQISGNVDEHEQLPVVESTTRIFEHLADRETQGQLEEAETGGDFQSLRALSIVTRPQQLSPVFEQDSSSDSELHANEQLTKISDSLSALLQSTEHSGKSSLEQARIFKQTSEIREDDGAKSDVPESPQTWLEAKGDFEWKAVEKSEENADNTVDLTKDAEIPNDTVITVKTRISESLRIQATGTTIENAANFTNFATNPDVSGETVATVPERNLESLGIQATGTTVENADTGANVSKNSEVPKDMSITMAERNLESCGIQATGTTVENAENAAALLKNPEIPSKTSATVAQRNLESLGIRATGTSVENADTGANISKDSGFPVGTSTTVSEWNLESLEIQTTGTTIENTDTDKNISKGSEIPVGAFTTVVERNLESLGIRATGTTVENADTDKKISKDSGIPVGTSATVAERNLESLGIQAVGTTVENTDTDKNISKGSEIPVGAITTVAERNLESLGIQATGTTVENADTGANVSKNSEVPKDMSITMAERNLESCGIQATGTTVENAETKASVSKTSEVPKVTVVTVAERISESLGIRATGTTAQNADTAKNISKDAEIPAGTTSTVSVRNLESLGIQTTGTTVENTDTDKNISKAAKIPVGTTTTVAARNLQSLGIKVAGITLENAENVANLLNPEILSETSGTVAQRNWESLGIRATGTTVENADTDKKISKDSGIPVGTSATVPERNLESVEIQATGTTVENADTKASVSKTSEVPKDTVVTVAQRNSEFVGIEATGVTVENADTVKYLSKDSGIPVGTSATVPERNLESLGIQTTGTTVENTDIDKNISKGSEIPVDATATVAERNSQSHGIQAAGTTVENAENIADFAKDADTPAGTTATLLERNVESLGIQATGTTIENTGTQATVSKDFEGPRDTVVTMLKQNLESCGIRATGITLENAENEVDLAKNTDTLAETSATVLESNVESLGIQASQISATTSQNSTHLMEIQSKPEQAEQVGQARKLSRQFSVDFSGRAAVDEQKSSDFEFSGLKEAEEEVSDLVLAKRRLQEVLRTKSIVEEVITVENEIWDDRKMEETQEISGLLPEKPAVAAQIDAQEPSDSICQLEVRTKLADAEKLEHLQPDPEHEKLGSTLKATQDSSVAIDSEEFRMSASEAAKTELSVELLEKVESSKKIEELRKFSNFEKPEVEPEHSEKFLSSTEKLELAEKLREKSIEATGLTIAFLELSPPSQAGEAGQLFEAQHRVSEDFQAVQTSVETCEVEAKIKNAKEATDLADYAMKLVAVDVASLTCRASFTSQAQKSADFEVYDGAEQAADQGLQDTPIDKVSHSFPQPKEEETTLLCGSKLVNEAAQAQLPISEAQKLILETKPASLAQVDLAEDVAAKIEATSSVVKSFSESERLETVRQFGDETLVLEESFLGPDSEGEAATFGLRTTNISEALSQLLVERKAENLASSIGFENLSRPGEAQEAAEKLISEPMKLEAKLAMPAASEAARQVGEQLLADEQTAQVQAVQSELQQAKQALNAQASKNEVLEKLEHLQKLDEADEAAKLLSAQNEAREAMQIREASEENCSVFIDSKLENDRFSRVFEDSKLELAKLTSTQKSIDIPQNLGENLDTQTPQFMQISRDLAFDTVPDSGETEKVAQILPETDTVAAQFSDRVQAVQSSFSGPDLNPENTIMTIAETEKIGDILKIAESTAETSQLEVRTGNREEAASMLISEPTTVTQALQTQASKDEALLEVVDLQAQAVQGQQQRIFAELNALATSQCLKIEAQASEASLSQAQQAQAASKALPTSETLSQAKNLVAQREATIDSPVAFGVLAPKHEESADKSINLTSSQKIEELANFQASQEVQATLASNLGSKTEAENAEKSIKIREAGKTELTGLQAQGFEAKDVDAELHGTPEVRQDAVIRSIPEKPSLQAVFTEKEPKSEEIFTILDTVARAENAESVLPESGKIGETVNLAAKAPVVEQAQTTQNFERNPAETTVLSAPEIEKIGISKNLGISEAAQSITLGKEATLDSAAALLTAEEAEYAIVQTTERLQATTGLQQNYGRIEPPREQAELAEQVVQEKRSLKSKLLTKSASFSGQQLDEELVKLTKSEFAFRILTSKRGESVERALKSTSEASLTSLVALEAQENEARAEKIERFARSRSVASFRTLAEASEAYSASFLSTERLYESATCLRRSRSLVRASENRSFKAPTTVSTELEPILKRSPSESTEITQKSRSSQLFEASRSYSIQNLSSEHKVAAQQGQQGQAERCGREKSRDTVVFRSRESSQVGFDLNQTLRKSRKMDEEVEGVQITPRNVYATLKTRSASVTSIDTEARLSGKPPISGVNSIRKSARKESAERGVSATRESSLQATVRLESEGPREAETKFVRRILQKSASLASFRESSVASEDYTSAFITTIDADADAAIHFRSRSEAREAKSLNVRAASVENLKLDYAVHQTTQESVEFSKNLVDSEALTSSFSSQQAKLAAEIEAKPTESQATEASLECGSQEGARATLKEQRNVEAQGLASFSRLTPKKAQAEQVDCLVTLKPSQAEKLTLEAAQQAEISGSLEVKNKNLPVSSTELTKKLETLERLEKLGIELHDEAAQKLVDLYGLEQVDEAAEAKRSEPSRDFAKFKATQPQEESAYLFTSTGEVFEAPGKLCNLKNEAELGLGLQAAKSEAVLQTQELSSKTQAEAAQVALVQPQKDETTFKFAYDQESTLISMEREHFRMAEQVKPTSEISQVGLALREQGEEAAKLLAVAGQLQPKLPESETISSTFEVKSSQTLSKNCSAPGQEATECKCDLVRSVAQEMAVKSLKKRIGAEAELSTSAASSSVYCELHNVGVADMLNASKSLTQARAQSEEAKVQAPKEESAYGFWSVTETLGAEKLLKSPMRSVDSVSLASLASSEETSLAEAVLNRRPSLVVEIMLRSQAREASVASLGFERVEFLKKIEEHQVQGVHVERLETIESEFEVGKFDLGPQEAEKPEIGVQLHTTEPKPQEAKVQTTEIKPQEAQLQTTSYEFESEVAEAKLTSEFEPQEAHKRQTTTETTNTQVSVAKLFSPAPQSVATQTVEIDMSLLEILVIPKIASSTSFSSSLTQKIETSKLEVILEEAAGPRLQQVHEAEAQTELTSCHLEAKLLKSQSFAYNSEVAEVTRQQQEVRAKSVEHQATVFELKRRDEAVQAKINEKVTETEKLSTTGAVEAQVAVSHELHELQKEELLQKMFAYQNFEKLERQFSADEHTFDSRFSRESSRSETAFTVDTQVEGSVERNFKEDTTNSAGLFGRIFQKHPESGEQETIIDEIRVFRQFLRTLAAVNISASIISELTKLPEAEQSIHNKLVAELLRQEQKFQIENVPSVEKFIQSFRHNLEEVEKTLAEKAKEHLAESVDVYSDQANFAEYETVVDEMMAARTFREATMDSGFASFKSPAASEASAAIALQKSGLEKTAEFKSILENRASTDRTFGVDDQQVGAVLAKSEGKSEEAEKSVVEHRRDSVTRSVSEFREEKVDVCNLFGRMIKRKPEVAEAENIQKTPRFWQEELQKLAAIFVASQKDVQLQKTAQLEGAIWSAPERPHMCFEFRAPASKWAQTNALDYSVNNPSQELAAEKSIRGKILRKTGKFVRSVDWAARELDASWEQVLNDMETEYRARIITIEREELRLNILEQVSKDFPVPLQGAFKMGHDLDLASNIGLTSLKTEFSSFEESSKQLELNLANALDEFEAEGTLTSSRYENLKQDFPEFSAEEIRAAVQLVRTTIPKPRSSTDHIVHIDTTLKNVLATVAAQEQQANAQLTIQRAGKLEQCDTVRSPKPRDQIIFHSKASLDSYAEATGILIGMESQAQQAESTFRAQNRAKSVEKFKEVEGDEFEILSEYIGVYRDLEAETRLKGSLNLSHIFQAHQATEETATVTCEKARYVAPADVEKTFKSPSELLQHVVAHFSVEFAGILVDLGSPQSAPSQDTTCTLKAANFEAGQARLRESSETQLRALVNLHKIEISRPSQRHEAVFPEITRISEELR